MQTTTTSAKRVVPLGRTLATPAGPAWSWGATAVRAGLALACIPLATRVATWVADSLLRAAYTLSYILGLKIDRSYPTKRIMISI